MCSAVTQNSVPWLVQLSCRFSCKTLRTRVLGGQQQEGVVPVSLPRCPFPTWGLWPRAWLLPGWSGSRAHGRPDPCGWSDSVVWLAQPGSRASSLDGGWDCETKGAGSQGRSYRLCFSQHHFPAARSSILGVFCSSQKTWGLDLVPLSSGLVTAVRVTLSQTWHWVIEVMHLPPGSRGMPALGRRPPWGGPISPPRERTFRRSQLPATESPSGAELPHLSPHRAQTRGPCQAPLRTQTCHHTARFPFFFCRLGSG